MTTRIRRVVRACALATFAASCVFGAIASAPGAPSTITVSFTVQSSTAIDASACETGDSGATFGAAPAGTPVLTDGSCTVAFGSGNDTSMLRLYQQDGMRHALGDTTAAPVAFGGTGTVNDVLVLPGGRIWTVGNSRSVRYSGDGGVSWSGRDVPVGNVEDVEYVAGAPGAEQLVAVGWSAGTPQVWRTSNGGQSWTASTTGLPGADTELNGISLGPDGTLWAAANHTGASTGDIYRSIDGGATWSDASPPGSCPSLQSSYDVSAVSDLVIWSAGSAGARTCLTVDGGATWADRDGGLALQDMRGIYATSATDAWIVGHSDTVAWTDDGGLSWNNVSPGSGEHLKDLHIIDGGNVMWVSGDDQVLRFTDDRGATWTPLITPTTSDNFYAIGGMGWTVFAGGQGPTLLGTPANWIADYDDSALPGDRDWSTGADMFGACLLSATNGATLDGGTWTSGACTASDSEPWQGIADTSGSSGATVAKSPLGDTDATVAIRFGVRAASSATPGLYRAPITFEVLAPAS